MQVKSIAECSNILTFMKLPFVINIFILSIFEKPFYTGFTVHVLLLWASTWEFGTYPIVKQRKFWQASL